ncbi:MAG TPA: hypothetical protein VFP42_03965 [Acidimicrobiia bacterium]|nr:hypothetical protein [Acidimicrobiia bacterium]
MTHDQVRQLVRRINPIPDPGILESVDVSVLDMERSMEMQVDERPTAEERREHRWRGPVVGIAATAMVVIGALVYFQTDQDPVAEPAPNATSLDAVEAFEPLAPGAYFADAGETSSIRGTFVVEGSEWLAWPPHGTEMDNSVSLLVVEVAEVYTSVCDADNALVAAGSTAAALANQFASNGFIVREPVAPVTAFGHEGHKLVLEVPDGCYDELFPVWSGGVFQGRHYQGAGQVVEYWFLDVEGTPVMVEASHFSDTSEENVAELQAVLDTLVITP